MGNLVKKLLLTTCCMLSGCAWLQTAQNDSVVQSQLLVARSQQAEENGDLESAGKLLTRAIELNSEDASLYRHLAQLHLKRGESQQAVERLRFAVKKNPEDTESLVELSRILMQQGRFPEANQSLDAVLGYEPNHVEALMLLGSLEEQKNHTGHAMETYHRVLGIEPGHINAKLQIALLQMKNGELDQAAPALRWICQSSQVDETKKAEAYWNLGILYGRQGRWTDAVESLSLSMPMRREIPTDDWYRLAYARYKTGDTNGALRDLQSTLRQDREHAAALAMSAALQNGTSLQAGRIIPVQYIAPAIIAPPGW